MTNELRFETAETGRTNRQGTLEHRAGSVSDNSDSTGCFHEDGKGTKKSPIIEPFSLCLT